MTKPNVVFIMTDQQRCDTLGCYGGRQVHTPALDQLTREGIRFTCCYVTQPVCSPSRSSVVSGLYPHATSVVDNDIPLPTDRFSWLRVLHEQGWVVGYVGKWHLGTNPVPSYFDQWWGYNTGWHHWVESEPQIPLPGQNESECSLQSTPQPTTTHDTRIGCYRPDLETDYAIEFITNNQNRPFAMWLSYYPPHTPKTAPDENMNLYRDTITPMDQAIYHAMVNRIDMNIGRVVETIDRLGLSESTLIIFTSDHGENFPLRWNQHLKRLCYDQSSCVPLIMRQPGTITANNVCSAVLSNADLCPTILDFCGIEILDDLHGTSAKKLVFGDQQGWLQQAVIQNNPYRLDHEQYSDMRERCVVTEAWKLILNTHRPPELYLRASADVDRNNMYANPEYQAIVMDLKNRLRQWGYRTNDEIAVRLTEL